MIDIPSLLVSKMVMHYKRLRRNLLHEYFNFCSFLLKKTIWWLRQGITYLANNKCYAFIKKDNFLNYIRIVFGEVSNQKIKEIQIIVKYILFPNHNYDSKRKMRS